MTFFSLALLGMVIQMLSNSDRISELSAEVGALSQQLRDHGIEPAVTVLPAPVVVVPGTAPVPSSTSGVPGSTGLSTTTQPAPPESPPTLPPAPGSSTTTTTQPASPTPSTVCVLVICVN